MSTIACPANLSGWHVWKPRLNYYEPFPQEVTEEKCRCGLWRDLLGTVWSYMHSDPRKEEPDD